MKTKVNEIFSSIQGEGPVVGYKQLFIRFCGCNLKCSYCDTDFANGISYSAEELYTKITTEYNLASFHSISLTGGEPLLSVEFLQEFLPMIKGKTKIYLETNATLAQNLIKIRDYVDIISADIKLALDPKIHQEFFEQCRGIQTFAKIVFDENISDKNIEECINLGHQFNLELILQPKMDGYNMTVSSEFCNEILDKFTSFYPNVRLSPQVHKFLDVR